MVTLINLEYYKRIREMDHQMSTEPLGQEANMKTNKQKRDSKSVRERWKTFFNSASRSSLCFSSIAISAAISWKEIKKKIQTSL